MRSLRRAPGLRTPQEGIPTRRGEIPVTVSPSPPEPSPLREELEPLAPIRLAPRDLLLWLLAAGAVGVAGSALLEGARLVSPAAPGLAAGVLLPVEFALYLLVLREARGARLTGGGLALGLCLALAIRAALGLVLGALRYSPLAPAGLGPQFLLYYLRLWPGALTQICSVAIFIWLIRDSLVFAPAPDYRRQDAPLRTGSDEAANRRDLLSALMSREAEEELPESVVPEEARRSDFMRPDAERDEAPPPLPPALGIPPPAPAGRPLPPPEGDERPPLAPPAEGEPLLANDPRLAEPILLVEEPPDYPPEDFAGAEETSTFLVVQGEGPWEADPLPEPEPPEEES